MAFISGAAASRLYLASFNAFVWCPARRINRVRSAAVKRRAFVSAERRSQESRTHQNHIRPAQTTTTTIIFSVDVLEFSGSSAVAGYFCSSVSG